MGDLRVPLDPALDAFGLPVVVTRPAPDDTPVTTTGFWLPPLDEVRPYGTDFQRYEPRKRFVIPRSAVASMPRGTQVLAAEFDGDAQKTWRVDGLDAATDPDHWRVIVIQV